MVIIHTVWFTHDYVDTTVITVTCPQFAWDKSRFVATLQCRKLTYQVRISDEQKL